MSSKSVPQILKILSQTGDINIFVLRGVILRDILINELRVNILTSCVYCTSYELQVFFITRAANYFWHMSYELLFIARVTSYFLHTG